MAEQKERRNCPSAIMNLTGLQLVTYNVRGEKEQKVCLQRLWALGEVGRGGER
jgi:hypothetical protein